MADSKISALPASTVPLAGTEILPIVQSGVTKQVSVQNILSSAQPTGTANGVAYLNGSKVLTTGSALTFDGTNFGLGVTPSVWLAGVKPALQWGTGGTAKGALFSDSNSSIWFAQNMFYNTAGSPRYIASKYANMYIQDGSAGGHIWQTAPSGTAGNAITFTQAMTLHASGGLSLGNTTDPGAGIMTGKAFQGNGAAWTGTSGNVQTLNPPSSSGVWMGWNKSGGFTEANLVYGGGYLEIGRWNGTTYTAQAYLDSSGNLGLGGGANASAILDAQSTTKGVRMPNMTTTQKNAIASPAAGLMVFDTTLAKLCVYSGAAWQTITSI
jgi:hypothetical protein